MPRATVSTEVTRYDLETCPGGWVELKRMTYGQLLERIEMAMKMTMQGSKGSKDIAADMKTVQREVTAFEFKLCISAHNLEDENDNILNFNMPMTYAQLDPKIGSEISKLIEDMNQLEATEEDLAAARALTS